MVQSANKKTDATEPLRAFGHVGSLSNNPSGEAEVVFSEAAEYMPGKRELGEIPFSPALKSLPGGQ